MKPFVACLLLLATVSLSAQDQPKNLKVLKDLPTDQLVPVMVFMSNSLGVSCIHCHTNKWESDEKEAKGVARTMITMVRDINDRHFGGEQAITCNSCHRGQIRPITTPRIATAYYNAPPPAPKSTTPVPPVTINNGDATATVQNFLDCVQDGGGGGNGYVLVNKFIQNDTRDKSGSYTTALNALVFLITVTCNGNGTLLCDLCGGDGVRTVPLGDGMQSVPCTCGNGYFSCAACSGGGGVCGRCGGTGFLGA